MAPKAYVVGSGASGGMVARVLALTGTYQVTIFEKGTDYFADPATGVSTLGGPASAVKNVFANDELGYESRNPPIGQDVLLEPRSFRTDSSSTRDFVGDVNTLPTTVGGGTTHYDAKARRLREVDFQTNSLLGGSAGKSAIPNANYADWPLQYRHLEAFYAVSEEVVGVQGPAKLVGNTVVNENRHESWRSTPYAMPPGVAQLNSLLPASAGNLLGYGAAPVPTSVNSRPYRGRAACNDCAFCLNYGCPTNAKGGGVWQVNEAMAAGATLMANTVVTGFEIGTGFLKPNRVTRIDYLNTQTGVTGFVDLAEGDILVLANTPVEATRLSLISNGGKAWGASLDPSGMLGRNLMFHLQSDVICIVDRDIHSWRGRTSTHTIDAFAGAGPASRDFDPAVLRAGILELGGNQNPIVEASDLAGFIQGEALKAYVELGPFSKRLTTFTMQGEDMPQSTNMVDLDPNIVDVYGQPVPRVTYKNHPYELAAAAFYTPLMIEIMATIGAPGTGYSDIHPLVVAAFDSTLPSVLPSALDGQLAGALSGTPLSSVPASRHIMGTHRLALEGAQGPLDPFGRHWAFDNLYHCGGGMYVTAPGYNVTLTMWALSYWAACSMAVRASTPDAFTADSYTSADIDAAWSQLTAVLASPALDGSTMIGRLLNDGSAYRSRVPVADQWW